MRTAPIETAEGGAPTGEFGVSRLVSRRLARFVAAVRLAAVRLAAVRLAAAALAPALLFGVLLASAVLVPASPLAAEVDLPRDAGRTVHDLAKVLQPAHARAMEATHRELARATGVPLVVLTVEAPGDESLAALADRAAAHWSPRDGALVLVYAARDRSLAIGGTSRWVAPLASRLDGLVDTLATPHLARGEVSAALYHLDMALATLSADRYGVVLRGASAPRPSLASWPFWTAILLAAFAGATYLALRHPRALVARWRGRREEARAGSGFGGGFGFGRDSGGGFGGSAASRGL